MSEEAEISSPGPRRTLSRAPLIRVLCQVRWPQLANFVLEETSTALARSLGDTYPILSKQSETAVTLTPTGAQQTITGYISRFSTPEEKWVLSVGNNFLALETSAYPGHEAFIERLRTAVEALTQSAAIPYWNRLGYRYTNRIVGDEDLARLSDWFSPSVLGGATSAPAEHELVHSITESVYQVNSDFVLARSARLRPGQSIDPTIPPLNEPSWVWDLDAFHEGNAKTFDPNEIARRATELAEIAHRQFTATLTEAFYERFE